MIMPIDGRFSWSSDAEARERMTAYIRTHFSTLLGDDVQLLDMPNGLELVQAKIQTQLARHGIVMERTVQAA